MSGAAMKTLIVPLGSFPHPLGEQVIDRAAAAAILEKLRSLGRPLAVDYRHESMNECGHAPAAGWVMTGKARLAEDGIVAPIEWTDAARGLIARREYMYLSPVFEARDGRITGLVGLGLTNHPNIGAMPPLSNEISREEKTMKESFRTRIRKALGLAPDAPEEQILETAKKLSQEREPASLVSLLGSAAALLGLTPEATDDEARERIAALAGRAAEAAEGRVERMVNDAVAAGRLRPSQREWAVSLGASNPESLRMFLVNSGPMVPVGGVMTECGAARPEPSLTEGERDVMRLLNISEEDFRRYGG